MGKVAKAAAPANELIWWRRLDSNYPGALKTHKLFILRIARSATIARNAKRLCTDCTHRGLALIAGRRSSVMAEEGNLALGFVKALDLRMTVSFQKRSVGSEISARAISWPGGCRFQPLTLPNRQLRAIPEFPSSDHTDAI
jgi:hypothetical protein